MILITLVLLPLLWDGLLGRIEGLFLAFLLGVYLTYVFHRGRKARGPLATDFGQLAQEARTRKGRVVLMDIGLLVVGAAGLLIGGKAIVGAAIYLARALEVSELVIGLTVVAIGTSLPELATSVIAAIRNQTDIAVGNVIGSNIFNIAGVLGIASAVKPIPVAPSVLNTEFPAVLGLSFLMLLVPVFPLTKGVFRIRRWEGGLLLGAYLGLVFWILS
jgi:cation:H+ antiporter